TVLNTNDTGAGSLRAAIITANGDAANTYNITFANSVSGTITLGSTNLLSASNCTINGQTSGGWNSATGAPGIILDGGGSAHPNLSGLDIQGTGDIVKGLAIINCDFAGIVIEPPPSGPSGSALIQDCFIGINPSNNTVAAGSFDGVAIIDTTSNTIGGTSAL